MIDELSYFCEHVLEGVSLKEAMASGGKLVNCRWVNCNKQDTQNPKVRGRLVAQEVNTGQAQDEFYAAAPPLEGKRVLFSRWAKEQTYEGKKLKLHFLDVRKAYFNARPVRDLYVRLPYELGMGKEVVGKLVRCMYGTRDAGALWEWTYTQCLLKMGFTQGRSNPCCVYHKK